MYWYLREYCCNCSTREELLKCAQSCTNEEQNELAKKTSLSAYICMDKLEGKFKDNFIVSINNLITFSSIK